MQVPRRLQLRRGNTSAISGYVGAPGELTVNIDTWGVSVHDGITPGGYIIQGGGGGGNVTYNDIVAVNSNIAILYANAGIQSGQITSLNSNVSTLTANAASQQSLIAVLQSNVVTLISNAAVQSGNIATIFANLGAVSGALATLTANAATQAGSLATLTANAGFQAGQIATIQANAVNVSVLNTANVAMKGYVDASIAANISALINGAPSTLDTLNELAAALGNDANLSVSITNSLSNISANVNTLFANAGVQADAIATLTANAASQAGDIATLYANAGVQANLISAAEANIVIANTAMKAYVDGQVVNASGYGNSTVGAYLTIYGGNILANDTTANTISVNNYIDFDLLNTVPDYKEGRLYYDSQEQTLMLWGDSANVELSLGQREWVRCRNSTANTIPKFTPVYATGVHISGHPVHGHHPTIDFADASDINKKDVIGITGEDIPVGEHGYVIVRGYIDGVNTSGLISGQRAHLGFLQPGTITANAPDYPNYPMDLGVCLTANATVGTFYVNLVDHSAERFRITQSGYVDGDFTVNGNLFIQGFQNTLTVTSLQVNDNWVYLGAGDTLGTTFNGVALNDMLFKGHYQSNVARTFYVKIDSVGSPDTFAWSYDNFTTTEANLVPITGGLQALDYGISIQFVATSGHTLNDSWAGTGQPKNVDFGIISNYASNEYTHTGLFRDASDSEFKFFNTYTPELTGNVNTSDLTFTLANVTANRFTGSLSGTVLTASQPNITQVGNLSGLSVTGNISTTGYLFGNGAFLTGIVTEAGTNYSNANVASYLPTYSGNLQAGGYFTMAGQDGTDIIDFQIGAGGNQLLSLSSDYTLSLKAGQGASNRGRLILQAGQNTRITVNGNGSNVRITASNGAQTSTWTFGNSGGLTFPDGSIQNTASNYGNTNVAAYLSSQNIISYGNTNVAAYLSSRNITSYGDSNVATYLNSYTGNLSAGNINVTTNISAGNLSIAGNITASYITTNGSNGNISGVNILYASVANISSNVYAVNYLYPNGISILSSIEGSINSLTANAGAQAGDIATIYANLGSVSGSLATLTANAGAQSGSIADLYSTKANLVSPSFSGNVSISGNLFVSGNVTVYNTNNVSLTDGMIYLADNNSGNVVDLGMIVSWNDSTYQHGGFVRDASDGVWKLFGNVAEEPTTTVNFANALYQPIKVGAVYSDNYFWANGVFILDSIYTSLGNINGTLSSLDANASVQAGNIATIYANLGSVSGSLSTLTANAGAQAGDIATLYSNAAFQAGQIVSTEANISTANTAMKGYVDGQIGSVTSAWQANAGAQAGDIASLYANAAAQAGNIASLQNDVNTLFANAASQAGTLATLTANAAVQSGDIATLTANAAVQAGELVTLTANAASQAGTLATLTANAASQAGELSTLIANAAFQAGQIASASGTFESLSKNIKSYPYAINYSGTQVANVVYSPAGGNIIVKALTYNGNADITSIAIYGNDLTYVYTKNLTYTSGSVSSVTYSLL